MMKNTTLTRNYYTQEQKDFLKENSLKMSRKELANKFNEKFGTNKTKNIIERYCNKRKWYSSETKHRLHKYTKEQDEFLKNNSPFMSRKELTKLFNNTFNLNLEESKITKYCWSRGWSASNDGKYAVKHNAWNKGMKGEEYKSHFSKEGLEKIQTRYLEAERKYKVGDIVYSHKKHKYVIVISDERGVPFEKRVMALHRYIYEQHHKVKLKPNEKIIFLDGDSSNVDINNLMCVEDKVLCGINGYYAYGKGILTEAVAEVIMAELELKEVNSKGGCDERIS